MIHPCPKPVKKKKPDKDNKALYLDVHNRDNGCCKLCGDPVPVGSVHHIYGKSHNTIDYLITLGWVNMCRCESHFIYHTQGPSAFIKLYCKSRGLSDTFFDPEIERDGYKKTAQNIMLAMIAKK